MRESTLRNILEKELDTFIVIELGKEDGEVITNIYPSEFSCPSEHNTPIVTVKEKSQSFEYNGNYSWSDKAKNALVEYSNTPILERM